MSARRWPTPEAFRADELVSFGPYEIILELGLEELDDGPQAHGWSARDVLSHLVGWHEVAAVVARELVAGPTSPRKAAADAEWEARGDEINDEMLREWRGLQLEAFRARARRIGCVRHPRGAAGHTAPADGAERNPVRPR